MLISLSLYANNILDNYRINGMKSIEKQMDLELTRENYWDEYLKDKDIKFGYIENYSSILTCNKEKSTLSLYKKNKDNSFEFKKNYDAFTGKIKGDKIKEGDLKTPIGIYNIAQKLNKDTKLDPFYGPLAFVTSYPNLYDKLNGKTGSGIWIHGMPLDNKEREKYTKGCIALDNKSLLYLKDSINYKNTILLINETDIKKTDKTAK